jgi:hypothetical protein
VLNALNADRSSTSTLSQVPRRGSPDFIALGAPARHRRDAGPAPIAAASAETLL